MLKYLLLLIIIIILFENNIERFTIGYQYTLDEYNHDTRSINFPMLKTDQMPSRRSKIDLECINDDYDYDIATIQNYCDSLPGAELLNTRTEFPEWYCNKSLNERKFTQVQSGRLFVPCTDGDFWGCNNHILTGPEKILKDTDDCKDKYRYVHQICPQLCQSSHLIYNMANKSESGH